MAETSKSRQLAAQVIFEALQILKENDGELRGRDVIRAVEQRATLDEWALERYEKSGGIRWQSILHFFTIDCVKAGFLRKSSGIWYLTPEGEEALPLGPQALLDRATAAYREWKRSQPDSEPSSEPDDLPEELEDESEAVTLEQAEDNAKAAIEKRIEELNAYEFQDLVAALLRGMGYHTPFVAPRGKDGGIDVLAYRDPLGTVAPRIKVQVKHRQRTAGVEEVRQLLGILRGDGDVGVFVSTGGFSSDSKVCARESHLHVELIDLDRFINFWRDFYPKLADSDKALLPLTPVFFLAPSLGE
jgi:restriction system protein